MTIKNKVSPFKLNKFDESKLLRLDIQTFAGEGEEGGEEGQEESGKIELTAEELQSKIDSETDKKLEKALQTARSKWEKEFNEKLEQEKREAERLAKLSEKERKEEELSKKEQEIANRLAELERKELKADAIADLTNKGLPSNFADFLLAENAEKTLENINNFKSIFDEAVNAAVKERLRQDTPPAGNGKMTAKNPFSKEHFNLTEQGRLLRDNPELYKQLKAEANK